MFSCSALSGEKYGGYEDSRFESDVDENFHCSICYNVLKDPRMCANNEHVFCLACITQYLSTNSQTCPECSIHMSVDTLHRAPRALNNYLSKLKINCDYAMRGCREFICVENLTTHVVNCEFAPVLCSNEECGMVVNKKDVIHHETMLCGYKKNNYYGCELLQNETGGENLMEFDAEVKAAKQKKMEKDSVEMETILGNLEGRLVKLDGKVETANQKTEKNQVEMEKNVEKLEGCFVELDGKVEAMNAAQEKNKHQLGNEIEEVKKDVANMKNNLCTVAKDLDDVKVMMTQILEKVNAIELINTAPPPTVDPLNASKGDILVAGGHCRAKKIGKSTEIYSWEENAWIEMSPMNDEHIGASSFIHKDKLFVVGGDGSKKIETLDLKELPLKWMKFSGELPYKCDDHQSVVHEDHVLHIGGYISNKSKRSNSISKMELAPPCTLTELCKMPEPRDCHGVEIFQDKVLILGGQTSHYCKHAMDSVLQFDARNNQCKELSPLPNPLTEIATVRWRDQVVVLGGRNKIGQVLNDVFMYHSTTGKITALPSMLEKRYECCSVITGNTIVVLGGINEKDEYLNSAECFTMGGSTWEYLPAMDKARYRAVAEVLPLTIKSV
jgi:hypothetical protein